MTRRVAIAPGLGLVLVATFGYILLIGLFATVMAVAMLIVCGLWLAQRARILHYRGQSWGWREWTVLLALGLLAGGIANWVWV